MSMNLRSRAATRSPADGAPSSSSSPASTASGRSTGGRASSRTPRKRSVSRSSRGTSSPSPLLGDVGRTDDAHQPLATALRVPKSDTLAVAGAAAFATSTTATTSDAMEHAVAKYDSQGHLLPYDAVPDHLKELHIFHGYRKPGLSVKECVHSIFSWHNETMNVWTHMLGFIFFLFLFFYCALYMSPVTGFIPHNPSGMTVITQGNQSLSVQAHHPHPLLERAMLKLHDVLTVIDTVEEALHNMERSVGKKFHEMEHMVEDRIAEMKQKISEEVDLLMSHLPSVTGLTRQADELIHMIEHAIEEKLKGTAAEDIFHVAESILHNMKEYLLPRRVSRWPVFLYIFCAMVCLLNSTLYHLFGTHSFRAYKFLARCDYSGIALLIAGSCFPAVYYGFYCSSLWKWVYLSLMCAVGGVVVTLCNIEWFYEPRIRILRAVMFVAMGCIGVIPALHMLFHVGADVVVPFLMYMAAMGFCYLSGVTLYAARIPERYAPGKFDLVGHSHQLFHILVVVAAYIHFLGCVHIHETLTMYSCDAFL